MKLNVFKDFDEKSSEVVETARIISTSYTQDLDDCIKDIKKLLNNEMLIEDLNNYIIQLPILLYELNSRLQDLCVKKDIAVSEKRHKYDTSIVNQIDGTVSKRASVAKLLCEDEQYIEDIYTRVLKNCEKSIDIANDVYNSLKKVLQVKITEMDMTRNNMLK